MQKTYMQKSAEVTRKWHLIDVSDSTLGRSATEIAVLLMGKKKPTFTPHIDAGDYVVVVNASKVRVTGNKAAQKTYFRHSGHPGSLKGESFAELIERDPAKIIEKAVFNMLPKNKLRTERMARLKVYAGENHPHISQLGTPNTSTRE